MVTAPGARPLRGPGKSVYYGVVKLRLSLNLVQHDIADRFGPSSDQRAQTARLRQERVERMDRGASGQAVSEDSRRLVCYCLQVTEAQVMAAIAASNIATLADVRRETGAGDGCTACHARLRGCLERCAAAAHSPHLFGQVVLDADLLDQG
jgi:bacterioferritin-associated ferredoxin